MPIKPLWIGLNWIELINQSHKCPFFKSEHYILVLPIVISTKVTTQHCQHLFPRSSHSITLLRAGSHVVAPCVKVFKLSTTPAVKQQLHPETQLSTGCYGSLVQNDSELTKHMCADKTTGVPTWGWIIKMKVRLESSRIKILYCREREREKEREREREMESCWR